MNRPVSEFLVLSVRPKFANAIVDGLKTIEFRRQRPKVQPGTLGFVYACSPVQAVIGSFRVDNVCSGDPEELWVIAQRGAHISKPDFDKYFAGAKVGHAIIVSCGKRFSKPINLSNLRVVWPGCKPPRSFGYLVAVDADSQRIMSVFKERWSKGIGYLEEPRKKQQGSSNRLPNHRGSFLLKGVEVRALASLLGV